MIKNNLILFFLLPMLVQACFKEDERVAPYPGDITTITDPVQKYQSYFDFESGIIVNTHDANVWQLGFECGSAGWHIVTNSGDGWFIYNTGQTSFDAVTDMPSKLNGLFDEQSAWPDSTAIGDWVTQNGETRIYSQHLYLLGKYVDGTFTQLIRISFLRLTDTTYQFCYRENAMALSDTVEIRKNDACNFVYYNFMTQDQNQPEPEKTSYDIVFGSYYDLVTLFGQTIPYQVGGALLNVWHTSVAIDSVNSYENIGMESMTTTDFTSQRDIPGYRWKTVTVDITGGGGATYDVKTNYNYIFHTAEGNYYKMRFISYTLDGKSGFPRFEYQKL
jgi:hypothetical protein